MASDNPFNGQKCDLGTGYSPTMEDISSKFRSANIPKVYECVICHQPARYKLISKVAHIPQDVLDRQKAYICQYHLEQKMFNPDLFAIRDLARNDLPILDEE